MCPAVSDLMARGFADDAGFADRWALAVPSPGEGWRGSDDIVGL
jgi:hypothetical protein